MLSADYFIAVRQEEQTVSDIWLAFPAVNHWQHGLDMKSAPLWQ